MLKSRLDAAPECICRHDSPRHRKPGGANQRGGALCPPSRRCSVPRVAAPSRSSLAGASGHLLAALDDIQPNTQLLATRTAIEHLERRLESLGRERSAVLAERSQALVRAQVVEQPKDPGESSLATFLLLAGGLGLLVALIVVFNVGDASGSAATLRAACGCFPLPLAALGLAWLVRRRLDAEERLRAQAEAASYQEVVAAYASKVARATEEIEACRARIEELKAQMDRLAGEI